MPEVIPPRRASVRASHAVLTRPARKQRSTVGTDVRVLPASHTALRPAAGFPTTRIHSSVLTVPAFALLEISDCPSPLLREGTRIDNHFGIKAV